jgi:hypothetical protein
LIKKKSAVIVLFFLLITASLFSNYQIKAEEAHYNFSDYLEKALNQSRDLEKPKLTYQKKKLH